MCHIQFPPLCIIEILDGGTIVCLVKVLHEDTASLKFILTMGANY